MNFHTKKNTEQELVFVQSLSYITQIWGGTNIAPQETALHTWKVIS